MFNIIVINKSNDSPFKYKNIVVDSPDLEEVDIIAHGVLVYQSILIENKDSYAKLMQFLEETYPEPIEEV
jgi:hypothetical protein